MKTNILLPSHSENRRTLIKAGTGTLLAVSLVDWLPQLYATEGSCSLAQGDSVCGHQGGSNYDSDDACNTQSINNHLYADKDDNCGNPSQNNSNLTDADGNCGKPEPGSSVTDQDASCGQTLNSSQTGSPDEACDVGGATSNDPDNFCSATSKDESCSSLGGNASIDQDEYCGKGSTPDVDEHCNIPNSTADPDNRLSYL